MNIGIDGNEANVENRVGVNEYAYQLLWNMYELSDEWNDEFRFTIYLKNKPKYLPKEKTYWKYKVLSGEGLWIIKELMPRVILNRDKIDLFFTPSHYLPPLLTMSSICSIMDLGYLESSEQFKKRDYWQLKWWSAYSMYISKHILSISKATRRDIVRHYPFASNKITVTLLGYDKERFNTSKNKKDVRRVKNKYSIGDDYVLFLSTLKPSKNIEGLLEAWAEIEKEFPDIKLVIAGKKGWLFENIFELAKELKIQNRVVFTGFVDEEDKESLIKGAKLFVLPSFWEGFGLDVLSAMASGVPVLTSNRGSLPEVSGNAAILIDPEKVDEIAGGMKKVLSMKKNDYNNLVEKGIKQASKFSWEKTARETIEVFKRYA